MRTLKTFCGFAATLLILSGCGGGSGAGSASSSTSGPPSVSGKGAATLTWTAPTTNTDGSALTDLAGFHIYFGTSAGSLSNTINIASPSTLMHVVSNLGTGTWYFAIAAYTNTGLESTMSNVGAKTIS